MRRQKSQNRLFQSQSEDEDEFEVTNDWKKTKVESLTAEFQEIFYELLALDAQLEELSRNVPEPPQEGEYRSIICGKCHLRGHRAEGNKNKPACKNPPCVLYVSCRQREKHPEHFEEIKKLTKQRKKLSEQLDTFDKNKKNLSALESKTISAFFQTVMIQELPRVKLDYKRILLQHALRATTRFLQYRLTTDHYFLNSWKNKNRNLKKLAF